ncbi:hypothetical protein ACOBQX_02575 [Actinokineospora sp. G85]
MPAPRHRRRVRHRRTTPAATVLAVAIIGLLVAACVVAGISYR